jgi:hypothetical protein
VLLTWTRVTTDVHGNALAISGHQVHRAHDRPTRFTDLSLPIVTETADVPSASCPDVTFSDLPAMNGLEGE